MNANDDGCAELSPEDVRRRLRANGYHPIPLLGKKAFLPGWPKCDDLTEFQLLSWSRTRPAETNTGILTRTCPAIDIDVPHHPDAAATVEDYVRNRLGDRGKILVRFGLHPKRAILCRTDAPFPKASGDT
jgi:hypothetical protein